MRLEGVEYEIEFHIDALDAESWVLRLTFIILI